MSKSRNFKKHMAQLNNPPGVDATSLNFERRLPSVIRVNDRPIRADELKERVFKTIESNGVYIYLGTERLKNFKELTPELEAMGLKVRIYSEGAIVSLPDFTPHPKFIAIVEGKHKKSGRRQRGSTYF